MKSNLSKQKLIMRSLAIAGGLTAIKLAVYFMTNSMAILASAADSFMDLIVSLANFLFIRSASKPADEDHAYGHGKIESLGGLLQSLVIAAMAIAVAALAIQRLRTPQPLHQPIVGVVITLIAIAVNFWHIRNLRRSMIESGSQVMASEYLHYASDIFAYIGVIASLLLFKITGSTFWDPLISLFIVMYLIKGVWSIFETALEELLDKQLPDPTLKEIDRLIRSSHPKVTDYHDLRTRKVGQTKFIEFHVVLRDVHAFKEAHEITESVIFRLCETYPGSIVTVHSDPEGVDDMEFLKRKD
jgi:ferrous-iron efflux pump FieF